MARARQAIITAVITTLVVAGIAVEPARSYALPPGVTLSFHLDRIGACGEPVRSGTNCTQASGRFVETLDKKFIGAYEVEWQTSVTTNARSSEIGTTNQGRVKAIEGSPWPIVAFWDYHASGSTGVVTTNRNTIEVSMSAASTGKTWERGFAATPSIQNGPTDYSYWSVIVVGDGPNVTAPAVIDAKGLKWRCDSVAAAGIGCINPDVKVKLDQTGLPDIVANIQKAVANGAPTSLHRGQGTSRANRKIACQTNVEARIGPRPSPDHWCEEYPFAMSTEGGAGATISWVPRDQQSIQGGRISGMYGAQRLVPGEEFVVVF